MSIIGIIISIFILISNIYLGKKKRIGFLIGSIGDTIFLVSGILTKNMAIIIVGLTCLGIKWYNYFLWRKSDKNT